MLEDIRGQPEVLATVLGRAREIASFADAHLRPAAGGRLYVFGSGDGWFAARAAAPGAAPTLRLTPRPTLELLLEDAQHLGPDDRVLAISMSGNVDRTLDAVTAARTRGAGVALLTNGDGGRVGAAGIPRLSLGLASRAPFLCGTASYLATLAALTLIVAADPLTQAAALQDLPRRLEQTIAAAISVVADWPAAPMAVRFLSVGAGTATADYGAAKLVEVSRVPAWTDDLEEFAHRQFWTAGAGELIVLLSQTADFAHHADAAAEALGKFGMTVVSIEVPGAEVAAASSRVQLPLAEPVEWPLLAAVPLQLYAYASGFAVDLDPNRRDHLRGDEPRFRTSRLLTRRTLVGSGQ